MTTIVYSGGVLATDSRQTNRGVRHKCNECDKITVHAHDERKKIKVPSKGKNVKFRGETVRAITGSGMSIEIEHAIKLLMRGRDIEKIYDAIYNYALTLGPKPRRLPIGSCRLVILTHKALYSMALNPRSSPEIEQHSLQDDYATGSGGDAAMLAMQLFSCSACDAVKAAIIADKYSGGKVSSYNVRRPKDGVKEELIKGKALQQFAESLVPHVKPIKKAAPKKKPAAAKTPKKPARKVA